ncbi:MAG: hypothetical protein SFY81_11790 [Verrucomicrobiota bacterium]|nr:hypothetical protein [Verrucomicrobiota bacterium]
MTQLLFSPRGTINRSLFLFSGIALFLLKYALDFLIVRILLDQVWWPWNYLYFPWQVMEGTLAAPFLMILLAIPFIWIGSVLTLKRLRSAALSPYLLSLFFVPGVNLLLFLYLSLKPPTEQSTPPSTFTRESPAISPKLPHLVRLFFVPLLSFLLVWFATEQLQNYGWGLFIGLPFMIGFLSMLLTPPDSPFSKGFKNTLLALALTALLLLLLMIEGIICILMAAPLALLLAWLGALLLYLLRNSYRSWNQGRIFSCSLLLLPFLMVIEVFFPRTPSLIKVQSQLEIEASPLTVWSNVIQFPELPPPTEWMFKLGIAYPLHATIEGTGTNAIRKCNFSTGTFLEPIIIWDEPNLLRFTVISNPPPMREFALGHVHPPHLENFLQSQAGEFKLIQLPGNRTRLEGTTWYVHNLWPEKYWQLWSDQIIHTIHLRVLNAIRKNAESIPTHSNRE